MWGVGSSIKNHYFTRTPQIADEDAAAAAAVASTTAFHFLCTKHGAPCLYCTCRKPYERGGGMIECARCQVRSVRSLHVQPRRARSI